MVDRRRRLRQADGAPPSTRPRATGEPYDLSSLGVILSSGVMWTAEVKQQLLDRIPQVVCSTAIGSTEGSMGNQMSTRGRRRRKRPSSPRIRRRRCSPRTAARSCRAPARSVWSPPADSCRSATSRTREVGAHVPNDRRRALRRFPVTCAGGRRRHVDPARPRQSGDQLRRREDLPGGGRRSREARARRRATAWWSASTTNGSARPSPPGRGDRRRCARRGRCDRPRRRRNWPATRHRSEWYSSPKCRAPPTARPTTTPPSSTPSTPSAAPDASQLKCRGRRHAHCRIAS